MLQIFLILFMKRKNQDFKGKAIELGVLPGPNFWKTPQWTILLRLMEK